MIYKLKLILINFLIINILVIHNNFAEPLVVLEYAGSSDMVSDNNTNSFNNEDYSMYYKIKRNDSLSGILDKFYSNYGLNLQVVQSAVVHKNRHAFVRNNANFMFANKKLYLPSINEIKNMIYKNKKGKKVNNSFEREKDIYFFGN